MQQPINSPWGKIQECETLCPGAYSVNTASHGGVMVDMELVERALSKEARNCGFEEGQYLCFEEDCDASVALRELMDRQLYTTSEEQERHINSSLQAWHKDYWQARRARVSSQQLPAYCYSCLASTGEIVILKYGETGFYKTDIPVADRDAAKELVKHYNDKLGVTKPQYEAMKAGSMFGWHTPAANPLHHSQNGVPRKPKRQERGDAR